MMTEREQTGDERDAGMLDFYFLCYALRLANNELQGRTMREDETRTGGRPDAEAAHSRSGVAPLTLLEYLLPLYLAGVQSADEAAEAAQAQAEAEADGVAASVPPSSLSSSLSSSSSDSWSWPLPSLRLSSSNFYLYYLRFHSSLATPCSWSEIANRQGALSIDPFHFHKFPFTTTTTDHRKQQIFFSTSACWETKEK
jgi:hypothetical protein